MASGPGPKLSQEQKATIDNALKSLLKRWKLVLKRFPNSNRVSNPFLHIQRFQLILLDLSQFLTRKKRKDSYDLAKIEIHKNCPEYFKRNYHYQTDGYLSYDSALRYDHQIELLFLGTAHIMRKIAYSDLESVLKGKENVLEFGAATGTSGYQFKQLFPQTKLDILEPSTSYLEYACKIYPGIYNKMIPEFMENLKPSQKYDCIFSCFVMHEIPVEIWDPIVKSIKNSLKPQGYLLIIDAQQNCDKQEHQFAIDQFAEDFFEPYFDEYRTTPLEDFFQQRGFELRSKNEVLFSKSLLFQLEQ